VEYILLRKYHNIDKNKVRYASAEVVQLPLVVTAEGEPLGPSSCLSLVTYLITAVTVGVTSVLRRRVNAVLGVFAFPQGLVAAIVARLTGRRFVVLTDGGDIDVILRNVLLRSITLSQLKGASTMTVQNNVKLARLSSLGVTTRMVRTIFTGIDTSRFAPLGEREQGTILYVGRMASEKCPLVLIETLRILSQRGLLVKLIMVGDGPLKTQIEKTAASFGVAELLTMTGYVPNNEVHRFYQKSAIFVLPSRREAIASALLEAMSSGCVCIASDIADNAEVVHPMFNGLLFHLNDAEDLANQISTVISFSESEVERLTSNARRMVERTYSVEVVGKALRGVFSDLVTD
jgi:glycosyltransferase involved in cell wall biosynthesis